MNRRTFLQSASLIPAGLELSKSEILSAPWREFEITTRIEVMKPAGTTRIWVPTALSVNTPFQKTIANTFECHRAVAKIFRNRTGAFGIVAAEFPVGVQPVLTVTSRVATRDWTVNTASPGKPRKLSQAEFHEFTQSTKALPTDGIVKQTATEVTQSARTDLEKAHAIYGWIVENTYRNPKTRGCGIGNVRFMLESGDLGGKCADINALYVAMARSVGLPARDVYGIRTAKSRMGFESLGPSSSNVTKSQHCRAEVYLNDYGWVPVDPADVRKVMLEEAPAPRPLSDQMVKNARARLFGSWEMNWMAYNFAQNIALPGSSGPPVRFLMYPQAETAGARLDSLDPDHFRYEITSR